MTRQAEVLDAVTNQVKEQHIDPLTAKVEKCYSKDRYQDFQADVEKIVLKILGHDDGKKIVKPFIEDVTAKYIDKKSWNTKQFWIPTILAGASIVVTIIFHFWK